MLVGLLTGTCPKGPGLSSWKKTVRKLRNLPPTTFCKNALQEMGDMEEEKEEEIEEHFDLHVCLGGVNRIEDCADDRPQAGPGHEVCLRHRVSQEPRRQSPRK